MRLKGRGALIDYLLGVGGLIGLAGGAGVLLRGAVGIARRFDVSPFLIGLTVVAVATSLPELLVCIAAAWRGAPEIILGNIVGSNIANTLLILGAAAAIAPFAIDRRAIGPDALVMLGVSVLLTALVLVGVVDWRAGAAMLALYGGYLFWTYRRKVADPAAVEEQAADVEEMAGVPRSTWLAVGAIVVGLALLLAGAQGLIDGAVAIARGFGVSDAVIGLTLVALGTSLPELAAAIVAARRGHSGLALGNVIGSNIMNVLAIAGVSAVTVAVPVPGEIAGFDIWAMLASAILPFLLVVAGMRIAGRGVGFGFLLVYLAYIGARFGGA